jgi:hypothetical protein
MQPVEYTPRYTRKPRHPPAPPTPPVKGIRLSHRLGRGVAPHTVTRAMRQLHLLLMAAALLGAPTAAQLTGTCGPEDDAGLAQLVVQAGDQPCVLRPVFQRSVHFYTCELPASTDTVLVLPYPVAPRTTMNVEVCVCPHPPLPSTIRMLCGTHARPSRTVQASIFGRAWCNPPPPPRWASS